MNGVYFEQLKYQLLRHLSARYYSHFLEQCGVISTRSVEQLATNTLKKTPVTGSRLLPGTLSYEHYILSK